MRDPEDEGPGAEEPDDGDDEAYPRPLTAEERDDVEADIEDLDSMRLVFEPQGAKGVVLACSDCGSNHYYTWELLRENLEHMLATGEPRIHEPAFEPREDEYVLWDYGKGYVDALADAGLDAEAAPAVTSCAWCSASLEPTFGFCPRCGRSVSVIRLYHELRARGIEDHEVRALLVRAGFEPFHEHRA